MNMHTPIIGSKIDPMIRPIVDKEHDGYRGYALEFLYRYDHLVDCRRWLAELTNFDPSLVDRLHVEMSPFTCQVTKLITQNWMNLIEQSELLGQLPVNDGVLHDSMLSEKGRQLKHLFYPKDSGANYIVEKRQYTQRLPLSKFGKYPIQFCSTTILWLDLIELALFVKNREYERRSELALLNDPYGGVLGLLMRFYNGDPSKTFETLDSSYQKEIIVLWHDANQKLLECPPDQLINSNGQLEIDSIYRQYFLSGDVYAFARAFFITQVLFLDPTSNQSLWNEAMAFVDTLPDKPIQLIDILAIDKPHPFVIELQCVQAEMLLKGVQA